MEIHSSLSLVLLHWHRKTLSITVSLGNRHCMLLRCILCFYFSLFPLVLCPSPRPPLFKFFLKEGLFPLLHV